LQKAPPGREDPVVTAPPARWVDLCGFALRGGTLLRCWLHHVQKDWDWAHRGLLAFPSPE
jgi:hypothetical protein